MRAVIQSVRVRRTVWAAAAAVAVLWPGRAIGPLDGVPLDGRVEAIVLGLVLPALWWFDRSVFDLVTARVVVAVLLALKLGSTLALTQGGFCTEFRAERPIAGRIQAIDFDDPSGELPSWDLRARSSGARCSAITARPYLSRVDFPAWFVNLLDNAEPAQSRVAMHVSGVVAPSAAGTLSLQTAPEIIARLDVDGRQIALSRDGRVDVGLDAGVHTVSMSAVLMGSSWMFVPLWNGSDPWRAARVTIVPPSRLDVIAPWVAVAIAILATALLGCWLIQAARSARLRAPEWAWIVAASAVLGWLGTTRFDRAAVLLLFGVLLLPAVSRRANVRGAFLLIGIPWLALVAGTSLDKIARFSIYTRGNDWLTYQISAYRIYQFGYWLDAGEKAFYYQPLYRWICGALHSVFGDSSVGELYWDAGCLLAGALLALHLGKHAGRRWAIGAAVATLVIAALGPAWYLIGRGLAEISAAGFAAVAALRLMRARDQQIPAACVAGTFAVLAYYCRLNHMLFAGGLLALVLPLRRPARAIRDPRRILARIKAPNAIAYVTVLAAGLALLAARTWYYGGRFSVFQGTSLALNYTGLEPAKMLHSVFATVIGNEAFDPRGLSILAGVAAAVFAIAQVPPFVSLPLGASLVCLAGVAGAFVAHAHGYPGRFSVHLLPVTTALVFNSASLFSGLLRVRRGGDAAHQTAAGVLTSPAAAHRNR